MSGFSADWLALREPFDLAVRNSRIEQRFIGFLGTQKPLRLLDLASGAGSTVAALGPKLQSRASWTLVDNDQNLLSVAAGRFNDGGPGTDAIESVCLDLARELDTLDFQAFDAVTTSAFLDLVTDGFLERLVKKVVASRKPFLASLSYDGRSWCEPADALDDVIRQAMNRHQQTDKGFGAALGPYAWSRAAELFRAAGYEVVTGSSDWDTGTGAGAFQKELLSGWLQAASEMGVDALRLDSWKSRRWREMDTGQLRVSVGHQDLCACPV
ncbi:class I SAM-dependent methyltransferase [Roseibium sp.]|uniref:class I SAM-dependent methyltransferase n=1 Tax=Roseibium sp. TaxID=1936156 RepID=UPI003A969BF4